MPENMRLQKTMRVVTLAYMGQWMRTVVPKVRLGNLAGMALPEHLCWLM